MARRAAGLQSERSEENVITVSPPFGSAILGMLLFLPVGLIALVFAAQANSKLAVGDIDGARAASATSQVLALIADMIGVVLFVLMAVSFF